MDRLNRSFIISFILDYSTIPLISHWWAIEIPIPIRFNRKLPNRDSIQSLIHLQMHWQTNGPTDTPSYSDARTQIIRPIRPTMHPHAWLYDGMIAWLHDMIDNLMAALGLSGGPNFICVKFLLTRSIKPMMRPHALFGFIAWLHNCIIALIWSTIPIFPLFIRCVLTFFQYASFELLTDLKIASIE